MIPGPRDVALAAEAAAVSLTVRLSLRTRGVRRTLALAHRPVRRTRPLVGGPAEGEAAAAAEAALAALATLAVAVNRAVRRVGARRPFAYTCLPRSLTSAVMLRRRGIAAEHRLGVGRDASGEFLAHAWVEVDGVPLGEPAGTLDGFHTVPLEAFLAATGDAARR